MQTIPVLLLVSASVGSIAVGQTCFGIKPVELPPLGHPNASQQCVCESMNRGCHWAWVDQPTNSPPAYVNQFQQALRDRIAAQRRENELRQQQQFLEQQQRESEEQQRELEAERDGILKSQNDQANDLQILKAVHDGILIPLGPGEQTTDPTIKNSSGQQFRVVAPASNRPTPPIQTTNSDQNLTMGLLNGRMWVAMSEPDRAFYVSAFLQGYAIACFYATISPDQQKECYGKLGDPSHTSAVNPQEIVDGVDRIFATPENRGLIIPVAIKAASMKVNGAEQAEIDKYLDGERNALAALSRK